MQGVLVESLHATLADELRLAVARAVQSPKVLFGFSTYRSDGMGHHLAIGIVTDRVGPDLDTAEAGDGSPR